MVVYDSYEWDGDLEGATALSSGEGGDELPTRWRCLKQWHSTGRARYLMRDRHPGTLAPLGIRSESRAAASRRSAVAKSGQR